MDSSLSPVPLDIRSNSANRLRSIPTYKDSEENLETQMSSKVRTCSTSKGWHTCRYKHTWLNFISNLQSSSKVNILCFWINNSFIMITWADVKTFHCHVVLAHLTAKKLFHIARELEWTLDSGKSKVLILCCYMWLVRLRAASLFLQI